MSPQSATAIVMRDAEKPVDSLPLERIRASVVEAVAGICQEGTPGDRLRGAIDSAVARASETCGRWGCDRCSCLWVEPGLSCEARRLRNLVKRIAMALLPMVRRGCALDAVRAALEGAVSLALGFEGQMQPTGGRPLQRSAQ
jgi:hypothetical protein